MTSDDFSNDIIHYDVTRHELIPIPDTRTESSWEIIYGNWLLLWYSDHLAAYRMVDNRHESILVTRLMPVSYISISSDDRFVVLLDDTDLPGDSHIRIIDIMTHETLLEIAPQYHEALIPIGFVPNGQ